MNHQPRHRSARRILALAVVGAFGLAACGGDDVAKAPVAESASNSAAFGLVLPQQALELSGNIDVTVIDVRTPEEFAEGHIDGATMIDFYEASFSDDIAALDHDGRKAEATQARTDLVEARASLAGAAAKAKAAPERAKAAAPTSKDSQPN